MSASPHDAVLALLERELDEAAVFLIQAAQRDTRQPLLDAAGERYLMAPEAFPRRRRRAAWPRR